MGALPTGTVTFLFTDIEGSTKLWEEQPDAMRRALARHDALLRAAIETNGGHIFKTMGDAFCAAFGRASDAVDAALAIQQAMRSLQPSPVAPGDRPHAFGAPASALSLRVRVALHTGPAELREGDYFGPALNRVARLLDVTHGGQVTLSAGAREMVQDDLPQGASLRDLGAHRLRDLQRAEQVFQLLHADLPADFPPLTSLEVMPNNLPLQVTSFVGREKEMAEVRQLLETARLVTLTGTGGTGKTRLALQVAAELLTGETDGVWLVELAALADAALVPPTVASVLSVREEAGRRLTSTLVQFLKPKRLLLVLDNCEHLLEECAALAEALLRGCPGVQILATSREGLNIAGEATYRLPSLALPESRTLPPTVERLMEYEAVRLFIDRATAALPAFTLTGANAPAVAQVCLRLDGIPLAIELAAARVKVLPVEKLNERLDDRFRLLTGGSRTALPRQQTLRALIDWSYDLLSEPERALLRRLSVFAGGWTLEAAEVICSSDPIEDREVLELLAGLADKSLAVMEEQDGEARYTLLETVRQYARDRLLEAGEAEVTRDRHLEFFLRLVAEERPRLRGAHPLRADDPGVWLERLETEHDNMRAALEWSGANDHHTEAGLRLARGLVYFWFLHGHATEGRAWLDRMLEKSSGLPIEARAKGLLAAGSLASEQSDFARSMSLVQQSLALSQETGDKKIAAASLTVLGHVTLNMGDSECARTHYEESLALFRHLGDPWDVAVALHNLGLLTCTEGDGVRAQLLIEESLAITRQLGESQGTLLGLLVLGRVARHQREYEAARAHLKESLTMARKLGFRRGQANGVEEFAALAAAEGKLGRAARLLGAAEGVREAIQTPSFRPQRIENDRSIATARAALGEDAFTAAWTEGRAMTLADAVALALEEESHA